MTTNDDEDRLLRSVALQNASSILIARQRAERRLEAHLAEAQRISHTGSFGWTPSTGEIFWSEETFRIFQYDRTTIPTVELVLQRTHPEDVALVKEVMERAARDSKDVDFEHRLLMPDGSVKHVRVIGRALDDESGRGLEFVGAVMDISDHKRAEALLAGEKRLLEMTARGDSCRVILDAICRFVEELASGSLSSILLLDSRGNRLRHGAAPSLPTPYNQAVDGLVIGPSVGSCGTAAYRAEPVIVSDVATDPLWADFRDLALAHGLRACWSTPILSSAGKVLGTFAIYYRQPRSPTAEDHSLIRQITHLASIAIERKQAEEELRQSEAYLHEAQRLGRTGSYARSLTSGAVLASPELLRIFGYDPGEETPPFEMFRKRVHPEDLPLVEQSVAKALSEKTNWESDYRILLPDGSIRYVHSVVRPVLDDTGAVTECIGTVIDVTERKQADEERERLLASERAALAEAVAAQRRFRDLVNSVEGIVWEVDVPSFQYTFVSKRAEHVLGYPVERWLSERTFWKDHLHPEDREWVVEFWQSAIAEKRDHDFEYRMIAADGRVVLVRDLVTVVVENDRPTRLRGVMVDISKQKQAEEALRQARSDLAYVARLTTMGELTASLAHEVNQPIAAAVTDANTCLRWLTRDQPDLAEAREAASRIIKDVTRAADIVSRIRQLFRKGTPQSELVDVNEIIGEMIVLLRAETSRYSVSVRTELAADLPRVMGDHVQLQQVLMNLMINGIDAMKEADGTRELAIKSWRAENEDVAVSVTDTGVGLPAQCAEQIFNAFFTTKPHGTGMGLRISRSIIESHGGRLWAADNSPRGASFYFTLPAKDS
jgi:PAS domain S-box-containing protein